MNFLEPDDYTVKLRAYNLSKMIDDDPTILERAEDSAISQAKEFLFERYDTDAIFSASGAGRHAYLVKSIVNIVVYDLCERLPRAEPPKGIAERFATTMEWLKDVRDATIAADLPRRISQTTGQIKTNFRGGSVKRKSHL